MISSPIIPSRLIEEKSPFSPIYSFVCLLIYSFLSVWAHWYLFYSVVLTHSHHYLFCCSLESSQPLLHPFKSLKLVIVNLFSVTLFQMFAWWSLQNVASIVFMLQAGVSPILATPTQLLAAKQKVPGTNCGAGQVNPTQTSLSRYTWSE